MICRALDYADGGFADKIVLEKLAEAAGYSVPQFSRIFAGYCGITPMRYLHTVRIMKAAALLSENGRSVTDIAFSCGFGSLEVFERGFKKYYGVSASDYRLAECPAPAPFYLSEKIYYERLRGMTIDNGNRFDWGRTAELYAECRDIYPPEFWETLQSLGAGGDGQRILDIGTGTGILPANMEKYGGEYIGADISGEMIRQAEKQKLRNTRFVRADAHALPFENDSFDTVTALQCWVYFDKERLLPELRRVLKKDGKLYVMFMTWLPDEDELIRKSFAVIKQFNPNWSGFMKRAEQLGSNLRSGGFSVEQTVKKDCRLPFTKESWRDRLVASRGIGATLSDGEIELFKKALMNMLDSEAPDSFTLLHEAVIVKLKPDNTRKSVIKKE